MKSYPWVVESDPIFHTIAESFKAQVGIVIEDIDHAAVLPPTIFLLQNLEMQKNSEAVWCNLLMDNYIPRQNMQIVVTSKLLLVWSYLGQIPMIEGYNRCDLILQERIDEVVIVLYSPLVDLVS